MTPSTDPRVTERSIPSRADTAVFACLAGKTFVTPSSRTIGSAGTRR